MRLIGQPEDTFQIAAQNPRKGVRAFTGQPEDAFRFAGQDHRGNLCGAWLSLFEESDQYHDHQDDAYPEEHDRADDPRDQP